MKSETYLFNNDSKFLGKERNEWLIGLAYIL